MLGGKKWRLLPIEHVHMTSIYAGLVISMKEWWHSVLIEHRINNDQNFGLRNGYVMLTEGREIDSSKELRPDQVEQDQSTIDEDAYVAMVKKQ